MFRDTLLFRMIPLPNQFDNPDIFGFFKSLKLQPSFHNQNNMANILLISGSPTEKSKSSTLLDYVAKTVQAAGLSSKTVSLRDFPAEDLVQARYDSASFNEFKADVEQAKALVIATPIYKASFTGGLKALLDILPQNSLRDKTIVPLATAGTYGHLLALDYSLKPVLSALGATDLRQGVFVVDNQFQYVEGGFKLEEEIQTRLDTSLQRLITTVKALV